jgi:hypothetical protein
MWGNLANGGLRTYDGRMGQLLIETFVFEKEYMFTRN